MERKGLHDRTGFESTKRTLASLQRLLFCCQCSQLTKNVCTRGNCGHFFCKQCIEEQLGAQCPMCSTLAHAKDAQVNRQLSNIVSLSLELGRLLMTGLQVQVEDEGGIEKENQSAKPASSVHKVSNIEQTSTKTVSQPYTEDIVCTNNQKSSSQVVSPQKSLIPPPPPPQTRVRSKRRQNGVADIKNKTEKEADLSLRMSPANTLEPHALEPEGAATHGNISHAENTTPAASAQPILDTPRRRGRPRQTEESLNLGLMEKGKRNSSTPSSSTRCCRSRNSSLSLSTGSTPTSSPRSSPCGSSKSTPKQTPDGSAQSTKRQRSMNDRPKETNPQLCHFSMSDSTPTRSSRNLLRGSSTSTPSRTSQGSTQTSKKRKSATDTPKHTNPHLNQQTPQRGRKSLPSLLSPAEGPQHLLSSDRHYGSIVQSGNKKRAGGFGSPVVRVKRNAKGETPLHVAAIKGDLSAVKELLGKGDNPNVRDNAGWTPLHEAVNHGNTAVAEILLQNGAMVNTPGMENDTPLHDAVANNKLECVRLLIAYGASNSARNVHGVTALEMAKTTEMKEALEQPALQPNHATSQPEPEEEFLSLCFLGTALSRDQRGLLQKCAAMLHAKVVDNYSTEVTHVVSSVNADGQCPRTIKYLQAILGGKWIISFDWITICLEYGNKVSEEPFEIPGSSTHPNSNAAHKARINRRLQLPLLFDGCQMYLQGSFTRTPPSKHELTDLLRLGGAHLLTREPRFSNLDEYEVTVPYHASSDSSLVDCAIFIVHDEAGMHNLQACRMRTVPASWVIECIAKFSLVEPPSI